MTREEMKNKLMETIKTHPGLQKSTIAWLSGFSRWDIIDPLYEMVNEGVLTIKRHHDMANMESYEQYYIAEG